MSDLIERLRSLYETNDYGIRSYRHSPSHLSDLCGEAADKIASLRARIAELEAPVADETVEKCAAIVEDAAHQDYESDSDWQHHDRKLRRRDEQLTLATHLRAAFRRLEARAVPEAQLTCSCGRKTAVEGRWVRRVDAEAAWDDCGVCGDVCVPALAAAEAAAEAGRER